MFGWLRFNPVLGLAVTLVEFALRFGLKGAEGGFTVETALHCIKLYAAGLPARGRLLQHPALLENAQAGCEHTAPRSPWK